MDHFDAAHNFAVRSAGTRAVKAKFVHFLRKGLLVAALGAGASVPALAQVADFNVTVNTGPVPPNADTVYPGEATSVRITLSNNNIATSLTGVNFTKQANCLPIDPHFGAARPKDAALGLGAVLDAIAAKAEPLEQRFDNAFEIKEIHLFVRGVGRLEIGNQPRPGDAEADPPILKGQHAVALFR